MPLWIENILSGRVKTVNYIAFILTFGYVFNSTFAIIYVLTHATKLDTTLFAMVKETMVEMIKIMGLLLGYLMVNRSQKTDEK